ncbi:MAG: hypothetical protein V4717_19485 [Bacteroidota bacterium]
MIKLEVVAFGKSNNQLTNKSTNQLTNYKGPGAAAINQHLYRPRAVVAATPQNPTARASYCSRAGSPSPVV